MVVVYTPDEVIAGMPWAQSCSANQNVPSAELPVDSVTVVPVPKQPAPDSVTVVQASPDVLVQVRPASTHITPVVLGTATGATPPPLTR